jgi:hypothetical protein
MFKIVHRPADELVGRKGRVWDDGAGHVMPGLANKLLEDVLLISDPPPGACRILNIYWNPELGKAIFEYEDTPV